MRFSVVVPAHNEEVLLPGGLAAIAAAGQAASTDPEVIVVANRCADRTAEIATRAGATVIDSDARNISMVRNAGAAVATGDVIVTIDADSRMSPRALVEIESLLGTGRYVGGGTKVQPERTSAGIRATLALVGGITLLTGLSGAMFWCPQADFERVGGFDEGLLVGEDVDFARRLKVHGRSTGRRFTTLKTAPVVLSTRKFDRFGDWHMFAMALELRQIRAAIRGQDTSWVDNYFFDFNE